MKVFEQRMEIGMKCVKGKLKLTNETKNERELKEPFAMKMRTGQWCQ
jgi:hypothetical protein